jgi:hypothetical protein
LHLGFEPSHLLAQTVVYEGIKPSITQISQTKFGFDSIQLRVQLRHLTEFPFNVGMKISYKQPSNLAQM